MARKTQEPAEEIIDNAPQEEAAASTLDGGEGTDALVGGEAPPPSLAEQVGFDDDERWKDYRDIADPIELSKKLKDQVASEQERFERQLAERQREWQTQIANSPAFMQFQRHQQELATKPAEQEADPLDTWWKPPQVNRELIEYWTEQKPVKDEAGNVIGYQPGWKDNAPADLKKAVDDYDLYRQQWRTELFSDPRAKLMPLVENVARKIAQEQFNSFAQQYDEQQFFDRFGDVNGPNAAWLFAHDAADKVVVGLGGEPVLSDLGRRLFSEANALFDQSGGRISKKRAVQIAQQALMGQIALEERQRQAQLDAAKDKHQDERLKTLDEGAKRRPSRAGSQGKPENSKAPAQTDRAIDLFRQQVDRQGITDETFEEMFA